MVRAGWLVVIAGLAVGSCKREVERPPPSLQQIANADPLAFLQADYEMALGIDAARLRKSDLWTKLVEPMARKALPELAMFGLACHFDPITAIDSFVIAGKHIDDPDPDAVIVVGGLEREKVAACLDKAMREDGAEKSIFRDNDITTIRSDDGSKITFGFVNDTTLVGVLGKDANRAGLEKVIAGAGAMRKSPLAAEVYGKLDPGRTAWLMVDGSSTILKELPAKPKVAYATVTLGLAVSGELHVRLATPEDAKLVAKEADELRQDAGFAMAFDKLDLALDGTDVKLTASTSMVKLLAFVESVTGDTPTPKP